MMHRETITGTPRITRRLLSALAALVLLAAAGCTTSDTQAKRFTEILHRYPQSPEPLAIARLNATSADAVPHSLRGRAVTIMVHPAYSLFFREERRSTYRESKYDLLKFQLDNEARFIGEIAKTDNLLILVLPGNYQSDSLAPLSYTFFLNSSTKSSPLVYYIYSETSSSGALSTDTMVTLYGFLQRVKADKVLIGGGYIGRCQREFYNQLTTYVDKIPAFVVPEISSISPDDIDDGEAQTIVNSLQKRDYAPVKDFIEKKGQGKANVLYMPSAPVL
ncbi:MAG: hypothetical protein AABZ15_03085 [Nitrospirota bacterium]